jgi:LmbE family N-acetylglucosaminyl deacetylase
MISFPLEQVRTLLVVGAHADDIEIGCGATILEISKRRPDINLRWVVFSGNGSRANEARQSAGEFLTDFQSQQVQLHDFSDGYFPAEWSDIKSTFERLKKSIQPDLILTHYGQDFHQDHRLVSELTWNTFRDHLILEYEIPKYDGDLGQPNLYMPVEEKLCRQKIDLLLKHFPSQLDKPWFDRELFQGLMRLRGAECAAPQRYAEAFYARKACIVP